MLCECEALGYYCCYGGGMLCSVTLQVRLTWMQGEGGIKLSNFLYSTLLFRTSKVDFD